MAQELKANGRCCGGDEMRVIVVAFPSAGHVNPMLRFAKNICERGVSVTFVVTDDWIGKIWQSNRYFSQEDRFLLESFSVGSCAEFNSTDNDSRFEMLAKHAPPSFQSIIERLNSDKAARKISCIVYDSFLPWVSDIAGRNGIPAALFWTQSWAAFLIYHFFVLQKPELVSVIPEEIEINGVPKLSRDEVPTFLRADCPYTNFKQCLVDQFRGIDSAKWVMANSFDQLEKEETEAAKLLINRKLVSVGPLVPSAFLNSKNPYNRETDTAAHFWKTSNCKDWLDAREPGSVVYVAFGSLAQLTPTQMQELAKGLLACNHPFLWVIRPPITNTEEWEVPPAVARLEKKRGMVVPWCSQTEVLSHPSVGVFVSHCGWNSVLEGLVMGVPVVGFPQWSDQRLNMKYIAEKWKMGVCLEADGEGLVKGEEVQKCVRFVMEKEEGKVLKENAKKWRQRALRDTAPSGSMEANLQHFISSLNGND